MTVRAKVFTLFLALAASPAWSQTISVTGDGEVSAAPDMAQVTLGVQSQAETAAQALAQNNQAMDKLLQTLRQQGIEEKDIQTTSFNVSPQYRNGRTRERPPEIVGYQVTNQVQVTVRDLDNLGATLDKVVQVGANRIHGIQFAISNPSDLLDKARRKAVANAQHKAQVLAKAASVRVGRVKEISESPSAPQPVYGRRMQLAESAGAVPIARGQQTLTTQVSVTFALESEENDD